MNDFSTWSRENLEKFAKDAHKELIELRADLKTALKAYRELNTKEKQK